VRQVTYVPADFGLSKNGPQFAWLDERLTLWGYPSRRLMDCLKDRVQAFQRGQGWSGGGADGLIGPKTFAILSADPTPDEPEPAGIDLTNWKLTLPTDANGDGKADEIKQPTLAEFKFAPFFYERADGGYQFRAPCDGATTTGSKFPRSELREMENGGKDLADWDTDDGAVRKLTVDVAFTLLPDTKPHVVGIQIHDGSDDVTTLRLEGTDLWVTKGDKKHTKIAIGYQLGTRIVVSFQASAAGIRWFLNGNHVATIDGTYEGCFAKCGCYTQASSRVPKSDPKYGTGYGEVVIYALEKEVA
jgi:hypothetical protein